MVEKQVDVGIFPGLAARRRPEHVQMFDARPFEVGFVLPQAAYGFVTFYK
jgi:hypothetical protein